MVGTGEGVAGDADGEEENQRRENPRRELAVTEDGDDVQEDGVDEHQGGEGQADFRQAPADHGQADAADHYRRVGDVKERPIDVEAHDLGGPCFPVEGKFLHDVQGIGQRGDPEDVIM